MKSEKQTVSPLKRVVLKMSAGKRPSGRELLDAQPVEFIFGIGRAGLTPMERRLLGKTEGETLSLELFQKQAFDFFGHVLPCPAALQVPLHSFYIRMKIERIEPASPREVVRAMAQGTECGGDCGCGCGCGET